MFKSIKCKNCSCKTWERDYHNPDIVNCINCNFERKATRRKAKKGITPSQERSLDWVIADLMDHNYSYRQGKEPKQPHSIEKRFLDYGELSVVINTTDHIFTNVHCHIFIGRKGGITLATLNHGVSGQPHNGIMAYYFVKRFGCKRGSTLRIVRPKKGK